jgi:hypothetical protein
MPQCCSVDILGLEVKPLDILLFIRYNVSSSIINLTPVNFKEVYSMTESAAIISEGEGASELIAPMGSTVVQVLTVLSMLVALVLAVKLLNWAVADKMSRTEEIVGSDVTAQVREQQLGCLAKNIYHEAANEPFEGKVAVAQVTLNRVASGQFPDDICRTIYQKNVFYERVLCQFSWTCDRTVKFRPVNPAAYAESMAVAKKVLLEGFRLPSLKNALYYHAAYIDPKWKRKRITRIGQHIFYE